MSVGEEVQNERTNRYREVTFPSISFVDVDDSYSLANYRGIYFVNWLNPPAGTYTIDEYLEMHQHWMDSTSANRNEVSLKADPLDKKFFGDKKLTITGTKVKLEIIHEQGLEPDDQARTQRGDSTPDSQQDGRVGLLGSGGRQGKAW